MSGLNQLPERGWGVLRDQPWHLVLAWWLGGYIKAQATPTPNVWHARLTGAGRDYLKQLERQA